MMNGQTEAAVMLNGEEIEDIENFIYLGSKVSLPGNASGGLVRFTRRRGLSQWEVKVEHYYSYLEKGIRIRDFSVSRKTVRKYS